MQGSFATSPYHKTLPIQAHETWPGVTAPFCVGPWTGSQGPWATDHGTCTYVPAFSVAWAQLVLDGFARAVVRGPTAGGYGAQSLQLSRRVQDHGPRITYFGGWPFSVSGVDSSGISFVW